MEQVQGQVLKPGYKTTEFWATLAAGLVPVLTPALPPTWAAALPVLAGAAYTASRAYAKAKAVANRKPRKPRAPRKVKP